MSDEVDDYLEHYGVPGMRWGKRKRVDDPKSNGSASPRNEKREARRQAKSDKILSKADGVQKQIDDLKKNGTNSKFMRDKYGAPMATDSRSADMTVQFRYGHSKKELLAAEIKGLEASKAHFVADAKLASEGKLTSKEKMLIGAGVATAVVAGGIAYAVISDKNTKAANLKASRIRYEEKLQDAGYMKSVATRDAAKKAARQKWLDDEKAEQERFNSIAPGSKITYDDYWKKIESTEISRISGISKDAFDKMDDTPISVPAGHIFKRVSTDKEEVLRERIFAAFKDEDVERYKAVLPKFWGAWGIGNEAKGGYIVSIKAKEAITSPSQKERVKAFIELMGEDVKAKNGKGEDVSYKGREFMANSWDAHKSNEEVALQSYRNFSLGLVNKTPLSDAYFDKLKSKGFNAIVDDNDSGKLSDAPMLIFDTGKSMERIGATVLTEESIREARRKLIEVTSRQ